MSNDGINQARRQCFAIIKKLNSGFEIQGLSDVEVWDWVKSSQKVSSRSELSEFQWVTLAARLSAAALNTQLFTVLCDTIKAEAGTCRAYRIYADFRFRKVYDGIITEDIEQRCQRQADATGCRVRLHGSDRADGIIFFEPVEYAYDPDLPPIGEFDPKKPARAFELHKNANENETQWISVPFTDCSDISGWAQRHADETGFDVQITDWMEHFVLMQFSPTPPEPPRPTQPVIVEGVNDVTIDGRKWLILSHWDDADGSHYHWVSLDMRMERHIATAVNRKSAVESLVNLRCSYQLF